MRKALLFAGVVAGFGAAPALAENWVTIPSPTLSPMYDADSVYVQGGLIYLTSCVETTCVAGNSTQLMLQERYDCAARTVATFIPGRGWDVPNRQAKNEYLAGDNEYLPGTSVAFTMDAVCAKKKSWPKHSN